VQVTSFIKNRAEAGGTMLKGIILSSTVLFASYTAANEAVEAKPSFEAYIEAIKAEALQKGYTPEIIESSFKNVTFHQRAVKADKRQPEKVETLDTYLPKRVANWKIKRARNEFKKHKKLLTEVGNKYGVQPRFIVALWGLETNFGKIMGNYNVISALSTMAYEGRREAFFRKQLWAALTILQEGHSVRHRVAWYVSSADV